MVLNQRKQARELLRRLGVGEPPGKGEDYVAACEIKLAVLRLEVVNDFAPERVSSILNGRFDRRLGEREEGELVQKAVNGLLLSLLLGGLLRRGLLGFVGNHFETVGLADAAVIILRSHKI